MPKDGDPSRFGPITMTTRAGVAAVEVRRLVRSDVAMTGEVSLTEAGVLPIKRPQAEAAGTAHRAGITTVLIPKRNEPDLEDVPEKVREALEIHLVSDVREVLGVALERANAPATIAA